MVSIVVRCWLRVFWGRPQFLRQLHEITVRLPRAADEFFTSDLYVECALHLRCGAHGVNLSFHSDPVATAEPLQLKGGGITDQLEA